MNPLTPSERYDSKVSRKERLVWSFRQVSWSDWMRSGLVGVITVLLMGDLGLAEVVAGFVAAGLVHLAQVAGNYAQRSEPHFLRERLDAARNHLRSLETASSDRVAKMVAAMTFGQNMAALADNIHSEAEVEVWMRGVGRFMDFLVTDVKPLLAEHEWLRLRDAEDDGKPLPRGQVSDDHRHEARKLRARLRALQETIEKDTQRS